MYKLLLGAHSGFRYLVFIAIIASLVQAFSGWLGKKSYTKGNKKLNLLTLISAHIQLLLGLALYFFSPFVLLNNMGAAMKDSTLRYWTVEHLVMMIIAIALITIGHSKSKKAVGDADKHKTIAIFYSLAFIIIIVTIIISARPLVGSVQ